MKPLSRRDTLAALSALGVAGCLPDTRTVEPVARLPDQIPGPEPISVQPFGDATDALFDVLVPAERDAAGRVVVVGARECGADAVLRTERLVRLVLAQGLVTPLPEAALGALDALATEGRTWLNRQLDALATAEQPLTPFRELPRARQEAVVQRAFDDDALAPALQAMRAAAFLAYLGGGTTDAGLVAIGFPAFESFEDGLAVRGYPRMVNGVVDDYTTNRAPMPTPGDDLSLLIDAGGDLR